LKEIETKIRKETDKAKQNENREQLKEELKQQKKELRLLEKNMSEEMNRYSQEVTKWLKSSSSSSADQKEYELEDGKLFLTTQQTQTRPKLTKEVIESSVTVVESVAKQASLKDGQKIVHIVKSWFVYT
jgi:hypothetical protein